MRRLFTPALCLLSVLALLLAGCDANQAERALSGEWTLTSVTDMTGATVVGPIGSTLVFDGDGEFSIDSVNNCEGTYTSEYVVNQQILDFPSASCTEAAGTLEIDLVLLLGVYRDSVVREPALFASDPSRLEIRVDAPNYDRVLIFEVE